MSTFFEKSVGATAETALHKRVLTLEKKRTQNAMVDTVDSQDEKGDKQAERVNSRSHNGEGSVVAWMVAAFVLLLALSSAPTVGADDSRVCSCSPTSFLFQFNFSLTCPPVLVDVGPDAGIDRVVCDIRPQLDNVTDLMPVRVVNYAIFELGLDLRVIKQFFRGDLDLEDGEEVAYSSISATLDSTDSAEEDESEIPGGIQFVVNAENADGDIVTSTWILTYTNNCGAVPFEVGDSISWTKIADFGPARLSTCPVGESEAPTLSPTLSPTTLAPASDTESPTEDSDTGDTPAPTTDMPTMAAPDTTKEPTSAPSQSANPTESETLSPTQGFDMTDKPTPDDMTAAPTFDATDEPTPVMSMSFEPTEPPVTDLSMSLDLGFMEDTLTTNDVFNLIDSNTLDEVDDSGSGGFQFGNPGGARGVAQKVFQMHQQVTSTIGTAVAESGATRRRRRRRNMRSTGFFSG